MKNKEQNEQRTEKNKHKTIERVRIAKILLAVYDAFAVTLAFFVALFLRFDCRVSEIPIEYLSAWLKFAPIYAAISVAVAWALHLYQSLWKFASFTELKRILLSTVILGVIHIFGITLIFGRMPISYYIIGIILQFVLISFVRFAYRFIVLERNRQIKKIQREAASRVMLIGAGSAGQMILRDIINAKEVNENVCCIIDDDRDKWGSSISGVPIVGGRDDILFNVEKYKIEKIFLAIPSATAWQRRDILNICKETDCELKNIPGLYQFVTGDITVNSMRSVAVEDLLGREPIKVDAEEIYGSIYGKTVLVTGGGGSIGSELCRQIASHNPKQLIVFDIYENNAHAIQLELRDKYPTLNLKVLIGSVRDSRRINQVFEKYKPDVVYHAAAHKHVPLMEDSPCESIKNNAVGTYKTAYAAMVNGCKRFVLISTDKAVNPTNIMGASKRICEMVIQSFAKKIADGKAEELSPLYLHGNSKTDCESEILKAKGKPDTEFVAVRFGNVLGSNGSVVPRFKQQIANGGPVTVTHPDIIRYFMTIPEAASLVLQASTYAKGGEIFVLDMGSPVKIDTLARNLIRLSGLKPDVDIKIEYTGLRPGEKLFEEKLMSEEGLRTTPNKLIHIGNPVSFDTDVFLNRLQLLTDVAYKGDEKEIRELVASVVPTYRSAGVHGTEDKGEAYVKQMRLINDGKEEGKIPV